MKHTDVMIDRAMRSALGILDASEAGELARHLESGCKVCAEAIRSSTEVTGALGYGADAIEPPPRLRGAVLGRIAAEAALETTPVFDAEGVHFARTAKLDWQAVPLPGFQAKVLSRDPERGLRTQLLRLQAGAVVPAHLHTDVEELFVLEGDLIVNDVLMQAGDYCRAQPDSVHRASRSPSGCVFLVISSEHDRPLEAV